MGAILVAFILGIVQGVTEFVPVSSSAHLEIVPWLFGWDVVDGYAFTGSAGRSFDFSIHLGTIAALLVFFRNDWFRLLRSAFVFARNGFKEPASPQTSGINFAERVRGRTLGGGGGAVAVQEQVQPAISTTYEFGSAAADMRFLLFLAVGTVPALIAGALLNDPINKFLDDHKNQGFAVMAIALAAMGLLMMVAERFGRKVAGLERMSWLSAIIIGIGQACAVIPGFSRSGTTITVGMFLGFTREAAARFTFLLALPITLLAAAKSALDLGKKTDAATTVMTTNPTIVFVVGVVTAGVVGYLVIGFLLRFLQRQPTYIFTVWRIVTAALVVFALATR